MTNLQITDESQIDALYASPEMADPAYEQAVDLAVDAFRDRNAQAIEEQLAQHTGSESTSEFHHLTIGASQRDEYGVSVDDYKDLQLSDFDGLSDSDIQYYMSRYSEDSLDGARVRAVAQRLVQLQGVETIDGWHTSGLEIEPTNSYTY
ncbi:hypothetical protein BCU93_13560 [Vibrio breoganii]|uniref:hypothetical protein n=1 Tax=Vibrio breoganii TaxID=553239 RepID=UPI000C83320D|nr:hypothetical protein [Vibrio breoganii]PMG38569.1 hypothetical protein BCU93_13560 [Vibrio breoganii]